MSHAVCSGSPLAHIFACNVWPVPLGVTSILILYHFFDDIMPTAGVLVYEPAGPAEPQLVGGDVPPQIDINRYAGFWSIDAVTPIDLPEVPVKPFDLTSTCASAPLYDASSM
jgi:hypothetical protein